jgi:hypothetical protein
MAYSNKSPEYRDNGYYFLDGIEYRTIWSFKNLKGLKPNLSHINGAEGNLLRAEIGDSSVDVIADIGGKIMKAYPIPLLKVFYQDQL